MDATTWTVSDLTRYIRDMFAIDYRLQDLSVEGEISNLTRARSGHLYLTLKDAAAQIRCVMWKPDALRLHFDPQHGDAVRAYGHVSVYEAGGVYQLVAEALEPVGRGDLHRQFEQLKAELEAEGLFDAEHKKPLPRFPRGIGVVTSPDAAAYQDILNVLRRRYPPAEVLLAPTLVQGEAAPSQIVRALVALDGRDDVDVIILARGGGSLEDLWAFNDRRVAFAVYGCRHPVVTGVGHETDFTIADFVADLRAPTPSAAAELATPDVAELAAALAAFKSRLVSELSGRIEMAQWRLDGHGRALRVLSPIQRVRSLAQRLDELEMRAGRAIAGRLRDRRQAVDALARALTAVSPLATLARGYAIVQRAETRVVVTDPAQVAARDRLEIQVHRGRFAADVAD
jgi:exodeoxyribonuclease VII large subunit